MAKVVPVTEARTHLTELLDDIESVHEHVVITRNGRPAAIVVSQAGYDSLIEKLEILCDEKLMADLAASDEDIASGWFLGKRSRSSWGLPDVVFTRAARDAIRRLPDSVRVALANTIGRLALERRASGAPLLGRLREPWSARVGNHRTVYSIVGASHRERNVIRAVHHRAVAYGRRRKR